MAQEMRLSNFVDDKGTLGNETIIGGPGAPDTVVRATAAMTPEQAAQTVENLGIPMGVYSGVDLTVKFADEIAAVPYNGNECAWIKAREQSGNYAGINVGDYIPLTTTNGYTFRNRIMGIDTYIGYGDEGHVVGHHIDWNFDELWPTKHAVNPVNYNNGIIPIEDVTADGTATTFVLTNEMDNVDKIEAGGSALSGWTYDPATYTITFESAPAAGTLTVTGTGSEHPYLSCDAYLFMNSLAGQVPNENTTNPTVKHVDYTEDGIYHYLPQKWQDIIVPKRYYAPKRYNAENRLSTNNAAGWCDLGNIWPLAECELFGMTIQSDNIYDKVAGPCHYPLFQSTAKRAKTDGNSTRYYMLLNAKDGAYTTWILCAPTGVSGYHNASYANIFLSVCFRT